MIKNENVIIVRQPYTNFNYPTNVTRTTQLGCCTDKGSATVNLKYDNNSYWPKVRKLANDYNLDENQTLYQKDSDTYLYIFNSFAEYVSKKYNIVFKFSSLYNRKNCNDYK